MRSTVALTTLSLVLSTIGTAAEINPVLRQPAATAATETGAQRIIVKFRPANASARVQAQSAGDRAGALTSRARISLRRSVSISSDMQALQVEPLPGESAARILERLRADPDVEFAVADQRRYPHAVPNDPRYVNQWYLNNIEPAAIDAESAWDVTTGSRGVVVAVVDTGVRYDHPDLKRATGSGRLLPGYDFISADGGASTFRTANDGSGRDSDPSDPGDWVTAADADTPLFDGCEVSDSSWHGTRVSGIVGALSNNSVGVTGVTWRTWLLPVRVLGKCGGFDSDVLAGARWAAGLHVDGVPDNPYPAKVINLSLGSAGQCSQGYQTVIDELTARGVLVVVSAGNESGPVDTPANCDGVAGIAGLRHIGTKVGFSSLGPEIALSAPSGNCGGATCTFFIDTPYNSGEKSPTTSTYATGAGTSFSAPIVSGIAALMLAKNGNLGSSQLIARLQEGATKPFPKSIDPTIPDCHIPAGPGDTQESECNCTTSTCGAGMANARKAVNAALRPIAAIAISGNVAPGQPVTLDGSDSGAACDRTVVTYAWTIVNGGSNPPAISGADTPTATVDAPATDPFTVRLTVTDSEGLQDTADAVVKPTSATSTAPRDAGSQACLANISISQAPDPGTTPPTPAPTSNDGGGGLIDPALLLISLFLLAAATCRRALADFATRALN
jgi:serine protease